MELRRFFVEPSDIGEGRVTLKGGEFLHMTKVLRLRAGFRVIVCTGDGAERLCVIDEIGADAALLSVLSSRRVDTKSVEVTLYAGILKNQKLDFVIQKAVELGVDRVVPFTSAHSAETRFNRGRAEKIALEAAKQCGSPYLTSICDPINFNDVLSSVPDYDRVLFLDETERKTPIRAAAKKCGKVALIVGSEGGFNSVERAAAAAAGALPTTLGRRILRAETASIVASALLLEALGELDYE